MVNITNSTLRKDAEKIYTAALREAMPEEAVRRALREMRPAEELVLVAIGKAAWRMAKAARDELGERIACGTVITKYGHSEGPIANLSIYEAGHPILDEKGLEAAKAALELTKREGEGRAVLFLVSGGGSALFESLLPGVTLEYMRGLNGRLLACGADIQEINTIRKLFSAVKGGRFASHCAPSKIYQIVLSDVLGDDLGSIASGPAAPNPARAEDIHHINDKYSLGIDDKVIESQRPVDTPNVTTVMAANVRILCEAAARRAEELGYNAYIIDDAVDGDVEELAERIYGTSKLAGAQDSPYRRPCALIFGGEPTVRLKGKGLGGRNQELALIMAKYLAGVEGMVFVSCGSDGTDGPTEAAGGMTDGSTWDLISKRGADPAALLADNDSNRALTIGDSLIVTGPTGTNVNDLILLLVGR